MRLNDEQLTRIDGGAVTASLLNAISRVVDTILEIGRTVGSAIRRLYNGNFC